MFTQSSRHDYPNVDDLCFALLPLAYHLRGEMDERPVRVRPSLVRLDGGRGVSFSGRNIEDEKDEDEEKRRGASRVGHFTSGRGVFEETTGTPRESSPRANVASSGGRFIFRPRKENESFDESSTLLAKTLGGRCRALS